MISVFGSDFSQREVGEVIEAITDQWVGCGPRVERFERLLAERLGVHGVAVVDSGSNGLLLAVSLLDLPGSEVVLPSFTWVGVCTRSCSQGANRCSATSTSSHATSTSDPSRNR